MIIMNAKLFLKKNNTSELDKEIKLEEVKEILQKLSNQFHIDIMELAKKVASQKVDGFSLNKNHPYTHLYIGNGSEEVSVELTTLEKEMKIKIPKLSFSD